MKTKKAFTLVELLVVIAILAILATATIVGFTAFTQKAKQSNLEGEMKQVTELLQLEDYYNDSFEIVSGTGGKIYSTGTNEIDTTGLRSAIDASSDQELISRKDRLSYANGILTLESEDGTLKAEWNVQTNTIKSGKADSDLWG